jgi:hypothetical protein
MTRTTRAVFGLAAMQYLWNVVRVAPLSGYDAAAHAAYALTLLGETRLPHPLEGWSTFHPPDYYIVLAALWGAFSWLGPSGQLIVGRLVSAVAMFAAAAVLERVLRQRGTPPTTVTTTVAVALFLPATQLAATTLGNEALGVAFASLALPSVLLLQQNPTDRRSAIVAGLYTGLALGTKFTGLFVAGACMVPFLRRGLTEAAWRTAALMVLVMGVLAGPVYLRNVFLTGTPIPMTRESGVVAVNEAAFVLRERRVGDYIGFSIETLRRPSILWQPGGRPPSSGVGLNAAHLHVWGSAYASLWFDAYARRLPLRAHRDGILWGPLLTLLGLVPTAAMLLGVAISMRELWRGRGRTRDASLLAMSAFGILAFVGFTARAPALVASKGSYLLPLLVPAGVFFARGADALPTFVRRVVLCLSVAAAVASAVLFTADLVYESRPLPPRGVLLRQAEQLQIPHLSDALQRFLPSEHGS